MTEVRLMGVWKVFGRCLELSGKFLERVWRVSEGCLGGIYKISVSGDRPSQDVPSQNRPCQVKSRQVKSGQSGQVMSGQVQSRLADPSQYALENGV